MQIRRFRNSDIPELVRIWNQYYQAIDPKLASVSLLRFQAAVLDRQPFSPQQCLVAEQAGVVTGFTIFPKLGDGSFRLACLCWNPAFNAEEICERLLESAERDGLRQAGITIQDRVGYVGMASSIGLAGVLDVEAQLLSCLGKHGYVVTDRWRSYELALPTFRVPVDRRFSALRRTVTFAEAPSESKNPAEMEAGWGHLDPVSFALNTRTGQLVAQVTSWIPGFAELASGVEALLGEVRIQPGAFEGSDLLLLSDTLRELASRRILVVRTAARVTDTNGAKLLSVLGFRPLFEGAVYAQT